MSEPGKTSQLTHPVAAPQTELRRSRRLPVQMPVVVRGKDAADREFFDRTEVVSIDANGARIRTRFLLNPGAILSVQLPTEEDPKLMRVVWRGEPDSFYAGMVGVEFAEPGESWNLESLRVRWGARKS